MSVLKVSLLTVVCLGGVLVGNAVILSPRASAEEARPSTASSSTFSSVEKEELLSRIEGARDDAQFYANLNWRSDVGLKWSALFLSGMITILAALARTDAYKNTKWIGIGLIVLGAGSTLLSAAVPVFSFSAVKIVYQSKVNALDALADDLRYRNPDRGTFLDTLRGVRSWTSETKVEDARLPESKSQAAHSGPPNKALEPPAGERP